MSTDLLHEAEPDLADLAGLPGAIRDKVKAGVAELRRLRDAVDVEIARLTGGAQATLASLQALATTEPEAVGTSASKLPSGDPLTPPADVASPPAL